MTTPLMRFPDVQRELVTALQALLPGAYIAIETPPDFTGLLPVVRVRRVGGASNRLDDRATVEVDVFAATYADAEALAEQLRQWLVGPPPPISRLDHVSCDIGPRELPWGPQVRRFNATYLITARRHTP